MASNRFCFRTFRGEYKVCLNEQICYIKYNESNNGVYLSGDTLTMAMTSSYMNYLCTNRQSEDENTWFALYRHLAKDIADRLLRKMFDDPISMIEFEKSKDFRKLISEVKSAILEFISIKREDDMKKLFIQRITLTNTSERIKILNTVGNTFGYFVVPINGDTTTKDPRNMIMVKSDPRNGYVDIMKRTYNAAKNNHPDFKIFNNDPYIQLNKELVEQNIPYV